MALRLIATAIAAAIMFSMASAQQAVYPYVISAGGGLQTGENVAVIATIGQPAAGTSDRLLAGF